MKLTKALLIPLIAAISLAAIVGCESTSKTTSTTTAPQQAPAEQHTAITTDALEPYECGTITRLHTYQGVFLASRPEAADIEQAQKGGVVTVINMMHRSEHPGFDEAALVKSLGLNYHNPAWNGPDELTDDLINEMRELLRTAPRPMLVHCSSANRVGAMWMAYRAVDEGLDVEAAAAEAKVVGLKSPVYEQKIRDYIARMK